MDVQRMHHASRYVVKLLFLGSSMGFTFKSSDSNLVTIECTISAVTRVGYIVATKPTPSLLGHHSAFWGLTPGTVQGPRSECIARRRHCQVS